MKTIYLDYAAATPISDECLAEMKPYWQDNFFNPSAGYLLARKVKQDLGSARIRVAQVLGAKPSEIVFTSGATESNNLAINGVMTQYPGADVVVSAIEHDSVLEPAKQFNHKLVQVNDKGIVELNNLQKRISDKTVLVSVMYVNNEIGTVQPLVEIGNILRQIRILRREKGNKLPLYLHTDAVQAGNYLDIHVSRLGVDLLTLNGGKLYGPKQSGALFIKSGVLLRPSIYGGGQEWGIRSGTENVAGSIGFSKALELGQDDRKRQSESINKLRKYIATELQKTIPGVLFNGSDKHMSPHILNVIFPGIDNERLMMELDEHGIMAAVGSACSASAAEPSHVLRAIGLSDDLVRSSMRFSLGKYSTKPDADRLITVLKKLIK